MQLRFVLLVCLGLISCLSDDGAPDQIAETQGALTSSNGTWLNGTWLNGTWLNGTWLNGVQLDGVTLTNVTLEGSMLKGARHNKAIAGAAMIGAELDGFDGTGAGVSLRIDDVDAPVAPSDVWAYALSFADAGGWEPICGVDAAGEAVRAIAVAGRWDARTGVPGGGAKLNEPGVITFACRGAGAIAKCVDMGYRPWATVSGVSLDQHHQACVRMVRGDLCGDGVSYTTNGRTINVYDGLGIQVRGGGSGLLSTLTKPLTWAFEAEWTSSGARCLSTDARDRFLAAGNVPSCLLGLVDLFCGSPSHFGSGTRTMNDVRATEVYLGL